VPASQTISEKARERLAAIKEAVELGSGFQLAARDLDIRGAGDILGANQHGHISAVGFEMYCRLIQETIQELKGEKTDELPDCEIKLPYDLTIPESFIYEPSARLETYRRFSTPSRIDEVDAIVNDLRDRYGELPESVMILSELSKLRVICRRVHLEKLEYKEGVIEAVFRRCTPVQPEQIMELLVKFSKTMRFNPPNTLSFDVTQRHRQDIIAMTKQVLNGLYEDC